MKRYLAQFLALLALLGSEVSSFGLSPTAPPRRTPNTNTKRIPVLLRSAKSDNSVETNIRQGVRGDRYNHWNSTIPSANEVALSLGVKPVADVPSATWKRAWKVGKNVVPFFHTLDFSSSRMAPDSKLCLQCLWWKALSGNDPDSPAFDDGLAYSLLPRGFRRTTQLYNFFPRLHHANVELRTAYLDRAVTITRNNLPNATKVALITLGCGYDIRSVKLKERGIVDMAIELDLPEVIESKQKMFQTQRFRKRTNKMGNSADDITPSFHPVNLNNVDTVKSTLLQILSDLSADDDDWHTVIVFEAVMIYLDEGVPSQLLAICSDALRETSVNGTLCFADRLENIPGGDRKIGDEEMTKAGWALSEWLPKPGLARHMGTANLARSPSIHSSPVTSRI